MLQTISTTGYQDLLLKIKIGYQRKYSWHHIC